MLFGRQYSPTPAVFCQREPQASGVARVGSARGKEGNLRLQRLFFSPKSLDEQKRRLYFECDIYSEIASADLFYVCLCPVVEYFITCTFYFFTWNFAHPHKKVPPGPQGGSSLALPPYAAATGEFFFADVIGSLPSNELKYYFAEISRQIPKLLQYLSFSMRFSAASRQRWPFVCGPFTSGPCSSLINFFVEAILQRIWSLHRTSSVE